MPKVQYSLPENLGKLEVSWNLFQTQYTLKLNGQPLPGSSSAPGFAFGQAKAAAYMFKTK